MPCSTIFGDLVNCRLRLVLSVLTAAVFRAGKLLHMLNNRPVECQEDRIQLQARLRALRHPATSTRVTAMQVASTLAKNAD